MTFGEKLRTARKAKNLTQKQLALLIQAAHNSISNWENDQNMPDPDTIQHLCWALNVEPNYFFARDAHKENPCEVDNIVEVGIHKKYLQSNDSGLNVVKIACRDGTYIERLLTDEQMVAIRAMLDALPDASEDL